MVGYLALYNSNKTPLHLSLLRSTNLIAKNKPITSIRDVTFNREITTLQKCRAVTNICKLLELWF